MSTNSLSTPGSPATARPCTRAGCPARDGSSWSRRSRSAAARSPCTTGARADSEKPHRAQLAGQHRTQPKSVLLTVRCGRLLADARALAYRTVGIAESRSNLHRDMRPISGGTAAAQTRALGLRLRAPIRALYTEPHGSVFESPPRWLVRRALRRHPARRSGAARACRRVDHGPCREVPHDPHGHEEACWRARAGGARHHGEGRARADLQARPAPAGRRGGMDREVPPALDRALRRAGQGCRGTETEGKGRWTQEERVSLPP